MNTDELLGAERAGICDDFERFGADAPTLCEGWSAIDLAAHLVVREHEPLAATGLVVPGPFASHLQSRMDAAKRDGFERLVERIRGGPALLFKVLGPRANLSEYFIHREDLRRPNGEGPRDLPGELEDFLWGTLAFTTLMAKARVRNFGLRLESTDGRIRTVRDAEPMAVVTGPPSEIALYMAGRKRAAEVEIGGPGIALTALEHARFGF